MLSYPAQPNNNQARADEPSAAEVEQALGRMLAELEFARNPSPARFLQFVVSETLAGRGDRLKAYAIATSALGRSENFDPQSDSIVRVQAVRLRSMLNSYYAGSGATDDVRIAIPIGTYRAKFAYASHSAPPPVDAATAPPAEPPPTAETLEPATSAAEPVRPEIAAGFSRRWSSVALRSFLAPLAAAASAVLVVLLAAAFWSRPRGSATLALPMDRPPVILIDVPQAAPQIVASFAAQQFLVSLEQGLAALDYVNVRMATPNADPGRTDYVLTTQFIGAGGDQAGVDLILRRTDSGDVLWTRRLPPIGLGSTDNAERVGHLAVSAVADVGGAVFSDLRAILMNHPNGKLRGYACRFAGLDYLRNREPSLHDRAGDCLRASVLEDPANVGLLTTFSSFLLMDYLDAAAERPSGAGLQEALLLARRAYDLAPQQADAQAALFYARFFDKRFDDAFQIARQAIATSSDSMLLALLLGRAYVSRGRYDEGVDLLKKVDSMFAGEQPIATAFLALAAHMRGDFESERRFLARPGALSSAMGLTLRIIECHERADAACVQSASAKLREDFPGFAADVPAALDRYALAQPQQVYLLEGLTSAGFAGRN